MITEIMEKTELAKKDTTRIVDKFEVGKVAMQGDIYLHMVPANHKHGERTTSNQLAIGTGMGSRHCAEGEEIEIYEGTTAPEWADPGIFLGNCIVAKSPLKITHPEHAHHLLPPGTYQVTHQMDLRTRQRVLE